MCSNLGLQINVRLAILKADFIRFLNRLKIQAWFCWHPPARHTSIRKCPGEKMSIRCRHCSGSLTSLEEVQAISCVRQPLLKPMGAWQLPQLIATTPADFLSSTCCKCDITLFHADETDTMEVVCTTHAQQQCLTPTEVQGACVRQ